MSVHTRLVQKLNAMPFLHAVYTSIGAMGVGAFVCSVAYTSYYYESTPGTWRSSLWGEATKAYHKFQCADPISHPEVRKK